MKLLTKQSLIIKLASHASFNRYFNGNVLKTIKRLNEFDDDLFNKHASKVVDFLDASDKSIDFVSNFNHLEIEIPISGKENFKRLMNIVRKNTINKPGFNMGYAEEYFKSIYKNLPVVDYVRNKILSSVNMKKNYPATNSLDWYIDRMIRSAHILSSDTQGGVVIGVIKDDHIDKYFFECRDVDDVFSYSSDFSGFCRRLFYSAVFYSFTKDRDVVSIILNRIAKLKLKWTEAEAYLIDRYLPNVL